MPILIESPDVEKAVIKAADRQPVRTSKTALAEGILRRALKESPIRLQQWLNSEPAQNVNASHDSNTTQPA